MGPRAIDDLIAENQRLRGLLAAQTQQIEALTLLQRVSSDREVRAERLGLGAAPVAPPDEAMVDAAIAAHDAAMGRRRDAHRVSKAQMPSVAEFKQWQREAFGAALVAAHACTASAVVDHGAAPVAPQPQYRMLLDGEKMRADDEALQGDGVTWCRVGPLWDGMTWSRGPLLLPARRRIDTEQATGGAA